MSARRSAAGAFAFAVLLSGCALLMKSEPNEPAYFTPESPADAPAIGRSPAAGDLDVAKVAAATPDGAAHAGALALRMGRIGGGSYLKERMVHRDGDHQLGFYENRRWTERPEIYLDRGLERVFFEERGLRRALAGAAPTLTADLVAFEEVTSPRHGVRLRVSYALHDERQVFREKTFTVERWFDAPIPPLPESVAAALGEALGDAVRQIADQVVKDLATAESE